MANQAGITLSEADLEKYGTDLLALDGWRSLKTDPLSDKSRGKGFGEKGMADVLYIRYAISGFLKESRHKITLSSTADPLSCWASSEILWIEWKRLTGRAAPHQRIWIRTERQRGALVLLAGEDFEATPEGFARWYGRESGLLRKPGLC